MGPTMNPTLELGQPALGLCNRGHVCRELRPCGRARGAVRPGSPEQRQAILRFSAVPQRHPSPHELTLFCDTELLDQLAEAVVTVGGHGCSVWVLRDSRCTKEHTPSLPPSRQPVCVLGRATSLGRSRQRWCDSWERCSEIQPWLMMPRLDSPLYHHLLDEKAVQAVRLNPIAIKMAMVIFAPS